MAGCSTKVSSEYRRLIAVVEGGSLAEIIDAQFAAFDDAFQGTDGDEFAAVIRDNYLAAIGVAPISGGCPFVPLSRSRAGTRRE